MPLIESENIAVSHCPTIQGVAVNDGHSMQIPGHDSVEGEQNIRHADRYYHRRSALCEYTMGKDIMTVRDNLWIENLKYGGMM